MTEPKPTPLLVEYINHRGETALRRIMPSGQIIFEARPPWHPKPSWLIPAKDVGRENIERDFALGSMFPVHPTGLMRVNVINDLEARMADLLTEAEMAVVSLERGNNEYRADKLRAACRRARSLLEAIGQEPLAAARVNAIAAASGTTQKE